MGALLKVTVAVLLVGLVSDLLTCHASEMSG